MQTNRTIEQARKLKTRDFRNEKYLNSYLQHCDAGYVTPRQFGACEGRVLTSFQCGEY